MVIKPMSFILGKVFSVPIFRYPDKVAADKKDTVNL